VAALTAVVCTWRSAPGNDVDRLALAFGEASAGVVDRADIRWEPSGGAIADATAGRLVLFLSAPHKGAPRDVWRARVRVTPEGHPVSITDVHDLTSTPLGDDHALAVGGRRAAFATHAFGQEQSVTVLDLSGEGEQNTTTRLADRAMAWVT